MKKASEFTEGIIGMKRKARFLNSHYLLSALLLLLCAMVCCACGSIQDEWSVYVYMCGSDLESEYAAATADLAELISADIPEGANIIIQTGGAKRWQTEGISADALQRWRVRGGGLEKLGDYADANMGEAATLSDFLSFCKTNYPAKREALLFWDHGGGGLRGVCFDEKYYNDSLTLSEIKQVLENHCRQFDSKFELIGFDACMMSSVGTAASLKDCANYLVASEETVSLSGLDYTKFSGYLRGDVDGAQLGRYMCDDFLAEKRANNIETCTLAVIDLGKMPELLKRFDAVAEYMQAQLGVHKGLRGIAKAADSVEKYGGANSDEGYSNFVDLYGLCEKLDGQKMMDAIDAAVVYHVSGSMRPDANGLSVYFPLHASAKEVREYFAVCASGKYRDFLTSAYINVPEETVVFSDKGSADENGKFRAAVKSTEFVIKCEYSVLGFTSSAEQEGGFKIFGLGSYGDVQLDEESGVITNTFDGRWPSVGGVPLSVSVIGRDESRQYMTAPIMLNGERTNLRFIRNHNGEYEILGTWKGVDQLTGMADKNFKVLEPQDVLQPVYQSIDEGTMETEEITGDTEISAGDVVIEDTILPMHNYQCAYVLTDIYGNRYESASAVFEAKGGKTELLYIA